MIRASHDPLHGGKIRRPVSRQAMSHDLRIHAGSICQRANHELPRNADAKFATQQLVEDKFLFLRELRPELDDRSALPALGHLPQRAQNLIDDCVQRGRRLRFSWFREQK
jgi:hypothetical protein